MSPEWSGMEDKRSGDDVAGISAILLRASRLAEAIPVLVWTGKKPEMAGDPGGWGGGQLWTVLHKGVSTTGKGLVSSSLQSLPAVSHSPNHLPRATTWCYPFACGQ